MDALILDFDGVVIDSEPVHFASFRHLAATRYGIVIDRGLYDRRYLGFGDRECFVALLTDHGRADSLDDAPDLIAAKTAMVQDSLRAGVELLPGAREALASASAAGVPVGICSGALRPEIDIACAAAGIHEQVAVIVSAEDVARSKPDPAGYLLALRRLSAVSGCGLRPHRSLAVEDAPAGVEAARSAGLRTLALTTSRPASALAAADLVVPDLSAVSFERLTGLTAGAPH